MKLALCMTLCVLYIRTDGYSTKKGLAVPVSSFRCHDLDRFTGVHWWYDWSVSGSYQNHCGSMKSFRYPMVWGSHSSLNIPSGSHYVLGYNEPNFRAQSNMSPEQAAQHWRDLERHAGNIPLVSPAAAPCGSHTQCWDDAIPWFEKFFKACQGCRVDYLATHAYWCNADTTMNYLKSLWDKFQKPIWITEMSCPQTHDANRQLSYMKELLPKLEQAHYVYRYAWFATRFHGDGWVTSSTALLHDGSNQLTTLGEYYNNY